MATDRPFTGEEFLYTSLELAERIGSTLMEGYQTIPDDGQLGTLELRHLNRAGLLTLLRPLVKITFWPDDGEVSPIRKISMFKPNDEGTPVSHAEGYLKPDYKSYLLRQPELIQLQLPQAKALPFLPKQHYAVQLTEANVDQLEAVIDWPPNFVSWPTAGQSSGPDARLDA